MVEYVLRIDGEEDGDVVRLSQEHFDVILDLALRGSSPDPSHASASGGTVSVGTVETVPAEAEFMWRGEAISEGVCERLFSAGFVSLIRDALAQRQVEADPYRDLRLHEELI